MSVKLKQAQQANKVSVESKQSGEVSVVYRDRDGKRQTALVGPFKTLELVPKLTDAKFLHQTNLDELVKSRAIKIVIG